MINLSIIIPIYNAEKYLKECLESIFCEINEKIEVILVDDGSTDNSSFIYNKYKDQCAIFVNSNHGVSYSRNFGVKHSHGDWIMFVDSDDVLIKGWSKIVLSEIDSKKYDLIYFLSKNINFSDKNDLLLNIMGLTGNNYYLSSPWSKVYNKKILLANNIIFNSYIVNGEDMIYNCKYISKIDFEKIKFASSIYKFRVNPESSTKKFTNKLLDSDKYFYSELDNILLENSFDNNTLKYINDQNRINNIFTIALRLSFNEKFYNYKNIIKELDKNTYRILTKFSIKNKINFVVFLILKKQYFLSFLLLKIGCLLKSKKNGEEYFISI